MRSQTRKISVFVDQFVCQDTKLIINTSKPGKPPLEFAISDLKMQDIGPGQPMRFDATLVNPKPVGIFIRRACLGRFTKKIRAIHRCKAIIPSAMRI